MSYRLNPNPHFWTDVTVTEPDGAKHTMRACYQALTIDAFNEFNLAQSADTARFLEETLLDWDQVEDEKGKALPFDPAALAMLISIPHVRMALVGGYMRAFAPAAQGN